MRTVLAALTAVLVLATPASAGFTLYQSGPGSGYRVTDPRTLEPSGRALAGA